MTDDFYEPAFVIHGKIPERKPPEPPPTPWRQLSDEGLASSNERTWEYAAARPVYRGGQPTGEWQVSTLRHKHDSTRRWITMRDQDEAYEWCLRINAHRTKQV